MKHPQPLTPAALYAGVSSLPGSGQAIGDAD